MNSHIIKNFDALARTPARRDALEVAEAGLAAVDTDAVVRRHVVLENGIVRVGTELFRLADYEHIYIVGCGKVACQAAATLEEILRGAVAGGAVVGLDTRACAVVDTYAGTHPKPSAVNFEATKHIETIAARAGEGDLVFATVGGGGSALLCSSEEECAQGERLYDSFLSSGGTIAELNLIRRHLSRLKGGGLARVLFPATVIGLIFSDVPGGDPATVASGPTYFDASNVADARAIVEKYGLGDFSLVETPKEKKYFERVENIVLVSNADALSAMAARAEALGYRAIVAGNDFLSTPREALSALARRAESKSIVLAGGEPSVVIPEGCEGAGGRNSFSVLEALDILGDNQVFVSVASDGRDNGDAAGALADRATKKAISALDIDLDARRRCRDSFPVFKQVGDLLFTGALPSNVSDLMLLLTQ